MSPMIGFFEPDPFPLSDPHFASILYDINSLLLQRRIIPIGSIRRMMAEFDLEREKMLDRCLLGGMLHFQRRGENTWIEMSRPTLFQDCHPACHISIAEAKERGLV
jgi:hypothetical protein